MSRFRAVLPTVVLRTHLGLAWILRMADLVLLSVSMAAARRFHPSRLFPYLMLGCAVVVSATESASGLPRTSRPLARRAER